MPYNATRPVVSIDFAISPASTVTIFFSRSFASMMSTMATVLPLNFAQTSDFSGDTIV
jgi:hypothetical protein